ncbi:MAG: hypothetical protein NTY01_15795, partial [Verrucomicrobia bacterium]|nr:hypothetical protein [Verrucomicrobiota bacterium]
MLFIGAGAATLAQEPKTQGSTNALLLEADRFTAKLPWFYHGLALDRWHQHDIYSFEVNALELPPGEYSVALLPVGNMASLAVSFDGTRFTEAPVREGRTELTPVRIANR